MPNDRDRDTQQGGKEAIWVTRRRGGSRAGRKFGKGRPTTKDRGRRWRRWFTEVPKGRGQGESRRAVGLGSRRSVNRPHEWPW